MAKVLQLKRGNTEKNNAYTGAVGELTVDTQAKTLRLHDGVTAGGTTFNAGGEANIIEEIKLNNVAQTVTDKSVNLSVQTPISADNKISSMFIDDTAGGTQNTHRFVTASDKTNWNGKQEAISDLGTIRTNASEALKQKSTLPTASATELGKIYQYTGTTSQTYVKGFFYTCVSDGQDPATYSWKQVLTTPINFWYGTQTEYDAIVTKDATTLYIIIPASNP